jgi:hypothetical protein
MPAKPPPEPRTLLDESIKDAQEAGVEPLDANTNTLTPEDTGELADTKAVAAIYNFTSNMKTCFFKFFIMYCLFAFLSLSKFFIPNK